LAEDFPVPKIPQNPRKNRPENGEFSVFLCQPREYSRGLIVKNQQLAKGELWRADILQSRSEI